MRELFSRMRDMSIKELKLNREAIFERTRRIYMQQEESAELESVEESQQMSTEPMELQHPAAMAKARKKKEAGQRVRSHWKRLMQVSEWMVEIPSNIGDFMIAARAEGSKCLLIFQGHRIEVRDKSGRVQLQSHTQTKSYDGTVLEVCLSQENKSLVVSDLIMWKHNPMTSSEFEFRQAWIVSNLNAATFAALKEVSVFITQYVPCSRTNLQSIYEGVGKYHKDGILFVHKESPYLHGINPNVLLWKDLHTSPYFQKELHENAYASKGVATLSKQGEVRSLDKVVLFKVDRKQIDPSHRFIRFTFSELRVDDSDQEQSHLMRVHLEGVNVTESARNHNGPVDSLSRLLYRCRLRQGRISIADIDKTVALGEVRNSMMQQQ